MNPDPASLDWGNPPIPGWVTQFRDHQLTAVEQIVDAYRRGAKVVMLNAPTGSGKTLIAELVRRILNVSAVYTCSTKGLQDQIVDDFRYARTVKGRANYPTELFPRRFAERDPNLKLSADDCAGIGCGLCETFDSCPYQRAKAVAAMSPMSVLNTAYLLGEAQRRESPFRGRALAVIDEADLLESALMSFIEVRVSKRAQQKYGLIPPTKKTVPAEWAKWVAGAIPKVRTSMMKMDRPRDIRRAERLIRNLLLLRRDLGDDSQADWIYTDYEAGNIVFKPVTVAALAPQFLWQLAQRFLLMSASLVSAQQMASDLGLEDDEWEYVDVPSTFPAENRPVYLAPIATMTKKEYEEGIGKMGQAVNAIIRRHPNQSILIHTVSYRLADDLHRAIEGPAYTYGQASDREQQLLAWKAHGGVMVAPSLDRGVDLPGDLCRVQVIVKVPYPYLGDKQVQARLYSKGGQQWYQVQTVRTLIQMSGRGVRSDTDHCTTYILDRSFLKLYRQAQHLFPSWWREALDFSGETRQALLAGSPSAQRTTQQVG